MVKLNWKWDLVRITPLAKTCIQLGVDPGGWKTAKGGVIPKPGKESEAGLTGQSGRKDSSSPDRGSTRTIQITPRRPVWVSAQEILHRRSRRTDQPYSTSVETKECHRSPIDGREISLQQRQPRPPGRTQL